MREFLEKNWAANLAEADTVRMAVKALMEVVDSGSKNIEIAIMRRGKPVDMMTEEALQAIITDIEREQEEAKKAAQDSATPMSF